MDPLNMHPDPPTPTPGCPQPTCSRVGVKSGGCAARLAFSSNSLWVWLSSEMGLRVMFIFSKAVEISPVYCWGEGSHDGGTVPAPGYQCQPCTPSSAPLDPGTPALTLLMFKTLSRDVLWSRCSVCHRAASRWHCLRWGARG